MSNSQSFDFNSLKRMTTDDLIAKCKKYVELYLSKSESERFYKAYKESRFDEVRCILEKTLQRIKTKINVSEYRKAENAVLEEFPDAEGVFVSSNTDEGSQDDKMGTGSAIIAVTVVIVAILVITIAGLIYLKIKNRTVGDILSALSQKDNKPRKTYNYTEKDRDLMALIHELSVIYDNTDKYMNS